MEGSDDDDDIGIDDNGVRILCLGNFHSFRDSNWMRFRNLEMKICWRTRMMNSMIMPLLLLWMIWRVRSFWIRNSEIYLCDTFVRISDEGQAHLLELSKLAEKDPEFYKYLQENDRELLEFNLSTADSHGDMGDDDMDGEDETTPTLTKEHLREWQKALLEVCFK